MWCSVPDDSIMTINVEKHKLPPRPEGKQTGGGKKKRKLGESRSVADIPVVELSD